MSTKNVTEAKAQLSALLEEIEQGQEVIITRGKKPIARLVPFLPKQVDRKPGRLKGQIKVAPDFDALSPELEEMFGLK